MNKLFQYGCSVSLGEEATVPYGQLVADYLGYEFVQNSESSASNPWIAFNFVNTCNNIHSRDIVLIGWSHPSRNSWYNKHTERWEHLNYIQQKKPGSALTNSVRDYISNQHCEYLENINTWYPKHIVESTCIQYNLRCVMIDCVPGMIDILMENKNKYIADHLHPNDTGHQEIFRLIKKDVDAIMGI